MFANKLVFSRYNFKFVYALTWIHAVCAKHAHANGTMAAFLHQCAHVCTLVRAPQVCTCFGMRVLARLGFFESKAIPVLKVLPVAIGFVGSVVLCNMSLAMNSVGFYQIMKVAVSPALVLLELLLLGRHQRCATQAQLCTPCASAAHVASLALRCCNDPVHGFTADADPLCSQRVRPVLRACRVPGHRYSNSDGQGAGAACTFPLLCNADGCGVHMHMRCHLCTNTQVVIHNIVGLLVGVAATVVTALYQVRAAGHLPPSRVLLRHHWRPLRTRCMQSHCTPNPLLKVRCVCGNSSGCKCRCAPPALRARVRRC